MAGERVQPQTSFLEQSAGSPLPHQAASPEEVQEPSRQVKHSSPDSQGPPSPPTRPTRALRPTPSRSQLTRAHAVACSLTHCHHHHGLTTPPLNTVTHRSQAESHTPGCTTIIIAGAQESHTLSLPPRGHGSTHPRHSPPRLAADLLGDVQEDVRAAVGRGNEAVALGPTEAFADSFVDRAL